MAGTDLGSAWMSMLNQATGGMNPAAQGVPSPSASPISQPSSNGYPQFSSSVNGGTAPVGVNPLDASINLINPQARAAASPMPQQLNPGAPTLPQSQINPWAMKQSSGGQPSAFDYPLNPPPRIKLNVL